MADLRERCWLDMAALVRSRFILAKVLVEKIKGFRQEACSRGYQETLFGPQAAVETTFDYAFNYAPNVYPASWYYQGLFDLSEKHYYPVIGEMKNSGEEFECACAIATLKALGPEPRKPAEGLFLASHGHRPLLYRIRGRSARRENSSCRVQRGSLQDQRRFQGEAADRHALRRKERRAGALHHVGEKGTHRVRRAPAVGGKDKVSIRQHCSEMGLYHSGSDAAV